MTPLPLSVIVVSRHRPAALQRCLAGLRQQDHPATEVIVVADSASIAAIGDIPFVPKITAFDAANISAARNCGLALAAGEVVAFIDDDAVPEPTWASRLVAPFADPQIVAATGFVRGRNGISYQWRACEIDAAGQDHPLNVSPDHVTLRAGTPDRAVKTQGTNCAFRAAPLRRIGGFDPAFRFFLDEADVNLRMAPLGPTAIVPMAQVHHGYMASERRRSDRVPLDLGDIAASTALFLRRHAPGELADGLVLLKRQQRARALRHMIDGRIEPREVGRLMATLARGWAEGMGRDLADLAPLGNTAPGFHPLPGLGPRPGLMIAGHARDYADLRARATDAAKNGRIVTLLCLAKGWRGHQHRFDPAGFWLQTGGLWGRADRDAPRPGAATLGTRLQSERHRLAPFRPV